MLWKGDKVMAIDYNEARKSESDPVPELLEALRVVPGAVQTAGTDLEEADTGEGFELPVADLSALELTVQIVPPQWDGFVCSSCFLVHPGPSSRVKRTA